MADKTINWGGTMGNLLQMLSMDYAGARERKLGRYGAGLGKLQEVAGMFGPGYMARQEKLALTGAKSALAARGLGGTTRPGAVSAGMKAGFEDVRRQGRAGAMTNIANYMAGFQDIYPEAGTLAHLATGGFSGMIAERGMGLQETQMGMARRAEAETAKGPSPWEAGFMGGGWSLGGGGGAGAATGGTARMPSTPGSPYGGYGGTGGGAGAGLSPAADMFQKPIDQGVTGDVGAGTMAGVTAGQVSEQPVSRKGMITLPSGELVSEWGPAGRRERKRRTKIAQQTKGAQYSTYYTAPTAPIGQRGYPAAM